MSVCGEAVCEAVCEAVALLCFCLLASRPVSLLLLLLSTLLLLDFRVDAVVVGDVVCGAVAEVVVVAVGDGVTPFEITSSCDLEGRAVRDNTTVRFTCNQAASRQRCQRIVL